MNTKSIIQTDTDRCFICKHYGTLHPHHIFNGAYRKKSEKYGAIIWVHDVPCHRQIHDNPKQAKELKKLAQHFIEEEITREEFINEFGKSYL